MEPLTSQTLSLAPLFFQDNVQTPQPPTMLAYTASICFVELTYSEIHFILTCPVSSFQKYYPNFFLHILKTWIAPTQSSSLK